MTTTTSAASAYAPDGGPRYLGAADATQVDVELMGPLGFCVEQLMELAGLSCAQAMAEVWPEPARVLVCCGPGNNGGDGLVAARHLHHFGWAVDVLYPKPTPKPLYEGLVTQLRALDVPVGADVAAADLARYDVVLDALFGFSFKGAPRAPFDALLAKLAAEGAPPVASVDIPSGWDVEEGDVHNTGLCPELLVSLTTPKLCARHFKGPHHFLGGRFVPPAIAEGYDLRLPKYPGSSQVVRLPSLST